MGFEPPHRQVRGSILVAGTIGCHTTAQSVQASRVQRRMGFFHFLFFPSQHLMFETLHDNIETLLSLQYRKIADTVTSPVFSKGPVE